MGEGDRLSVILFTDVVGYTARTESDPAHTLSLVTQLNAFLKRRIEQAGGRVWKFIGDAVLAEFPTALPAVTCALAIQKELARHNLHKSEKDRVEIRVSLHAGDVSERGGDVYGDTVNIAARLQSLAPPGGLCLSRSVYDGVHRTLHLEATPLGPQTLKGVSAPIEAFSVHPSGRTAPVSAPPRARRWLWAASSLLAVSAAGAILYRVSHPPPAAHPPAPAPSAPVVGSPWRASVAVLPFRNLSADPEQGYFCEGMTEQLITALARSPELKVIARSSVAGFRDSQDDLRAVARKLGVDHVVTGSVRRSGDRVRISAQLVLAADGANLWAEDYDRPMRDLFSVQDGVSLAIAAALRVSLAEPGAAVAPRRAGDAEAYACYLRGRRAGEGEYNRTRAETDFRAALALAQKAVALDPEFALGHLGLAHLWGLHFNTTGDEEDRTRRDEERRRAFVLDPDQPEVQAEMAVLLSWEGKLDEARTLLRRALAVNPSSYDVNLQAGVFLSQRGLYDRAVDFDTRAAALAPLQSEAFINRGFHLLRWGRPEDALPDFERAESAAPKDLDILSGRLECLTLLRRLPEARDLLAQCEDLAAQHPIYRDEILPSLRAQLLAREGRCDEAVSLCREAVVLAACGLTDRALAALSSEADTAATATRITATLPQTRHYYLSLVTSDLYDPLRGDPRFETLVRAQRARQEQSRIRYDL